MDRQRHGGASFLGGLRNLPHGVSDVQDLSGNGMEGHYSLAAPEICSAMSNFISILFNPFLGWGMLDLN